MRTAVPTLAVVAVAAFLALAPVAAAADPIPAADDQAQGIQDVVVTATRRETNLQRTPIAIAPIALSSAVAEAHSASSVASR